MVAALLLMKASASAGSRANGGSTSPRPPSQGRSPIRLSAVDASALRSPVPMAPTVRTGGISPRLSTSVSTVSSAGSTPEPPAASWLSRTTSMARASGAASSGPAPPAWLRSRRRPWPPSSTWMLRLAPTPVVRPYTG